MHPLAPIFFRVLSSRHLLFYFLRNFYPSGVRLYIYIYAELNEMHAEGPGPEGEVDAANAIRMLGPCAL